MVSFLVLFFRGFDKIPLTLYEYNINKYFTPLLGVTWKLPFWSECSFIASTSVAKTRLFYALLGSIVIGNFIDLTFFAWFKLPFTVATGLVKFFLT